jgi:hypothetical protein
MHNNSLVWGCRGSWLVMELPCNALPLATTVAAAAASELPPSAVQDSEGRGGMHIALAARG